jgi:hypothetical protein
VHGLALARRQLVEHVVAQQFGEAEHRAERILDVVRDAAQQALARLGHALELAVRRLRLEPEPAVEPSVSVPAPAASLAGINPVGGPIRRAGKTLAQNSDLHGILLASARPAGRALASRLGAVTAGSGNRG